MTPKQMAQLLDQVISPLEERLEKAEADLVGSRSVQLEEFANLQIIRSARAYETAVDSIQTELEMMT